MTGTQEGIGKHSWLHLGDLLPGGCSDVVSDEQAAGDYMPFEPTGTGCAAPPIFVVAFHLAREAPQGLLGQVCPALSLPSFSHSSAISAVIPSVNALLLSL